jgi:hypothetical protein
MRLLITILSWILRITFLAALILGLLLWSGRGYQYLQLHMWIGFVITFDLLLLAFLSLSRRTAALSVIGLAWAILLPVLGIAQLRLLPGPNHWWIRVLHLVLGLGAVGFGESLAKKALLRQRTE